MDKKTMFKLTYGLFVLTTQDGGRDNGCIINTAQEVATDPETITFAVNKLGYTHDMLLRSRKANISVIDDEAKFEMFKHFGFQSGRDVDKFADIDYAKRAENGIYYIDNHTNAYLSVEIMHTIDVGTHTLFVAKVVDAVTLSDVVSLTYAGYHDHVKEKLVKAEKNGKTIWKCEICGYEYEGEQIPDDFICPWCSHPAQYFHKI